MMENETRFQHYLSDNVVKSKISIKRLLQDDLEMFVLVAVVGSEAALAYTNYKTAVKYIYEIIDSPDHHDHAAECMICKLEQIYCEVLKIINIAKLMRPNISLIELAGVVLSSDSMFLHRESLRASLFIKGYKLTAPLIPISNVKKRLKYWDIIGTDHQYLYTEMTLNLMKIIRNYVEFEEIPI